MKKQIRFAITRNRSSDVIEVITRGDRTAAEAFATIKYGDDVVVHQLAADAPTPAITGKKKAKRK